jgi:hypothetical protein
LKKWQPSCRANTRPLQAGSTTMSYGLLDLLKANSHSTARVQELFWTAQDPPRITQATFQDNDKPKTFRCNGSTLPITIVTCQYQTQTNAEVKPGTSSYYLPDQTVQDEVRQTKESLNNEHLADIDTHPATLKAAYNLLTHSQGQSRSGSFNNDGQ